MKLTQEVLAALNSLEATYRELGVKVNTDNSKAIQLSSI